MQHEICISYPVFSVISINSFKFFCLLVFLVCSVHFFTVSSFHFNILFLSAKCGYLNWWSLVAEGKKTTNKNKQKQQQKKDDKKNCLTKKFSFFLGMFSNVSFVSISLNFLLFGTEVLSGIICADVILTSEKRIYIDNSKKLLLISQLI